MERQDIKLMIDRLNGVDCDTSDSHTIDDACAMLESLMNWKDRAVKCMDEVCNNFGVEYLDEINERFRNYHQDVKINDDGTVSYEVKCGAPSSLECKNKYDTKIYAGETGELLVKQRDAIDDLVKNGKILANFAKDGMSETSESVENAISFFDELVVALLAELSK